MCRFQAKRKKILMFMLVGNSSFFFSLLAFLKPLPDESELTRPHFDVKKKILRGSESAARCCLNYVSSTRLLQIEKFLNLFRPQNNLCFSYFSMLRATNLLKRWAFMQVLQSKQRFTIIAGKLCYFFTIFLTKVHLNER